MKSENEKTWIVFQRTCAKWRNFFFLHRDLSWHRLSIKHRHLMPLLPWTVPGCNRYLGIEMAPEDSQWCSGSCSSQEWWDGSNESRDRERDHQPSCLWDCGLARRMYQRLRRTISLKRLWVLSTQVLRLNMRNCMSLEIRRQSTTARKYDYT